ncbi:methyltransferase [Oxalobacteraceae bacterium OM1]|nr:methyltransferase [Oxalobacteraceae bacterium OM1]
MDGSIEIPHVTGTLGYLAPGQERPRNYMYPPPAGMPWENVRFQEQPCRIHDARRVASSLALERNGFELLDATGVGDIDTEADIAAYLHVVEMFALAVTGGSRAVAFDHLLRQCEPGTSAHSFGRAGAMPAALGRVHNDYTEASGPRRRQLVLPDAPDDVPYMILNFWRPVGHPAWDKPLALCDTRSIGSRHWVEADILYPDRVGQIYLATHSIAHRWYYVPAMRPDELWVFKSYDSRRDVPARMTPHCAFEDIRAPAGAPPRRSIEVRCLVLLD